MTPRTRSRIGIIVAVLFIIPLFVCLGWVIERTRDMHWEAEGRHPDCINNLKQIGVAFRTFALNNDGRLPFNLSTNSGGTLELCTRGSDGCDSNAAIHFKVASNELSTPRILVCPKDQSKKPATTFSLLTTDNVTYRLRTGTNISEQGPKQVLALCPIDGNQLYSDGSVMDSKGHVVLPFDPKRILWQTNQ